MLAQLLFLQSNFQNVIKYLLKDSFAEMLMIFQLFKNHLSMKEWWVEANLLTLCVYKQGVIVLVFYLTVCNSYLQIWFWHITFALFC